MPYAQERQTARIIPFRPRADAAADRRRAERTNETPPVVRCGSWYHEEAIREERARKP